MTTANSSGELTDASRPSCAIRSRVSAFATIRLSSACTLSMMATGVAVGANSPNQEMTSKPGKARLRKRWQFGNNRRAHERGDRKCAQLAIANERQDHTHVLQSHTHPSADHVGKDRATIGNMDYVHASEIFQQLARDVLRRADAGRGKGQLSGLDLCEGKELCNGFRRHLVVDCKNARHHQNACNRREIAYRIEGWARLQRWVDSYCAVGPPIECAAVGGRFCHALGPDTPAGTRNILDRHRHVPGFIQFLRK